MRSRTKDSSRLWIAAVLLVAVACSSSDDERTTGSGAGGSSTASATSSSSSSETSGPSTSSGGVCTPGDTMPCYDGPSATEGVAACVGGTATCKPDGLGFGSCVGEVLPATEDCNAKGDEDCDGIACSDAVWAELFGGTTSNFSTRAQAIATDAAGNIFLAGSFSGTLDFGNGVVLNGNNNGPRSFLVKLDPNGVAQWAKFPGIGIYGIAVDPLGNVDLAGYLTGTAGVGGKQLISNGGDDAVVGSFDTNGTLRFAFNFGSAAGNEHIYAIAADSNGAVVVAGQFDTSFQVAPSATTLTPIYGLDVFFAKFDVDGNHQWSEAFGDPAGSPSPGDQASSAVAFDSTGAVWISGQLEYSGIDFGSGAEYGGFFLAKLDANGAPVWSKAYGSTGMATAIAVDSSDDLIIAGEAYDIDLGGGVDPNGGGFVAKLDSGGNYQWAKFLQSTVSLDVLGAAVDENGDVVFSGEALGNGGIDFGGGTIPTPGGEDAFFGTLDKNGAFRWAKILGDGASQRWGLVAMQPGTGDVIMSFYNAGTVDVGTGPLLAPINADSIVLAAFQP